MFDFKAPGASPEKQRQITKHQVSLGEITFSGCIFCPEGVAGSCHGCHGCGRWTCKAENFIEAYKWFQSIKPTLKNVYETQKLIEKNHNYDVRHLRRPFRYYKALVRDKITQILWDKDQNSLDVFSDNFVDCFEER